MMEQNITLSLNSIPAEFIEEANKIRNHPRHVRRLTLAEICRTKSNNVITVGPSLQKTPRGSAFYSNNCFLCNFYKWNITFRRQDYTSLEQGYQCTKAELCHDRIAYNAILNANTTADMKEIGGNIRTNKNWEKYKIAVVEDLLFAKFAQNKDLYYSLLNTRPHQLIEATLDKFWGAGCVKTLSGIMTLSGINRFYAT